MERCATALRSSTGAAGWLNTVSCLHSSPSHPPRLACAFDRRCPRSLALEASALAASPGAFDPLADATGLGVAPVDRCGSDTVAAAGAVLVIAEGFAGRGVGVGSIDVGAVPNSLAVPDPPAVCADGPAEVIP
jgi:hypothetical protein